MSQRQLGNGQDGYHDQPGIYFDPSYEAGEPSSSGSMNSPFGGHLSSESTTSLLDDIGQVPSNSDQVALARHFREVNYHLNRILEDESSSQSSSSSDAEIRHQMTRLQLYQSRGINPCPWIAERDMDYIKDLGYQDPYYWPNLQDWTESLVDRFFGRCIDMGVIRQRFIRPKCVACGQLCQDGNPLTEIDQPVALPCGHIVGLNCLTNLCENFTTGEGGFETWSCPWKGPGEDEPPTWSERCGLRMFHLCGHPMIYMRLPKLDEDFYLPEDFFIHHFNGYVPRDCRRCSIKNQLTNWTQAARDKFGMKQVFATCSGIDGLLPGELRTWGSHPQRALQRYAMAKSRQMEEFLTSTPTPLEAYGARPVRSQVIFLSPCVVARPARQPSTGNTTMRRVRDLGNSLFQDINDGSVSPRTAPITSTR